MDRAQKVTIISVLYAEPEWQQTRRCIQACGVPVIFVDRKGTGSLAKAYNEGFATYKTIDKPTRYLWFMSNPTFEHTILQRLTDAMDRYAFAAIHPAFPSDHKHLQPDGSGLVRKVPYVEFTAPLVRADVFEQIQLDEQMPYWGHDLDWSYRAKELGYGLGVHHGAVLQHEYIRHAVKRTLHPVTKERRRLRKATDAATLSRIQQLYGGGDTWREKLGYYG